MATIDKIADMQIGDEMRIKCVEDAGRNNCEKCVCQHYFQDCRMPCAAIMRPDRKNVHFEIVKD